MNNKFFTAKEIYARIISTYKNKSSELSVISVMRWCAELVTDVLRDPSGFIQNRKIQIGYTSDLLVMDNRVPVPFNCLNLIAIYDQDMRLINDYMYQGELLFFSSSNCPTKVYIDYDSIPVDEDGFPLIKRGYEIAAYAYCLCKMFEEDATAIPPRIAQWRWFELQQNKDWEIEACARSWSDMTDNDVMRIQNMLIDPLYAEKSGIQKYVSRTTNRQ
jgi:hypothetical protein